MNNRNLLRAFSFSIPAVLCFTLPSPAGASGAEPRLPVGQHVADLNGIKFAYYVAGKGPLIVVQSPGWGIGSEVLRNGLEPLESKFALVFYDTRGSGLSSRPSDETKMSTSDMVDDLEGLRQYWGIPTMTLLGHSGSGNIALGYAIRYPKRVKKLILVDSDIQDFDTSNIVQQELEARKGDKRYESAIKAKMSSQDPESKDQDPAEIAKDMLPLYFYDPDKNLPIFLKTAPTGPSPWVMKANGAADQKSPGGFRAYSRRNPSLTDQSSGEVRALSMDRSSAGFFSGSDSLRGEVGIGWCSPNCRSPRQMWATRRNAKG